MATILVYNLYTNRMERYTRAETDPMPYSYGRTLLVREFRGSSRSSVMWTTTTAMESWNITRRNWGSGIYGGYAYKRMWEGGHGLQSQHSAGTSFDTMQNQTSATRRRFHQLCQSLGVWTYVEPISMTPSWVHFDKRYGSPACSAGYPLIRNGSVGVYVLVLQDALNALGYTTRTLDGYFGGNTTNALVAFQRANGLSADGICGCNTWRRITNAVVGIGRTSTVID